MNNIGKQALMHSSVYDNYRIETFDGKVYYVGDVDTCLRLKDLLNNYYRRINGL